MAQRGGGESRRLAGCAGAAVSGRARWGGGNPRRHGTECREQIYSGAAINAATIEGVERNAPTQGISPGILRDELSLAPSRKRGQGQARDVFYPGLQPGLDQS